MKHFLWQFTNGGNHRPYLKEPTVVQVNGAPWSVATNGKILVAVRGAVDGLKPCEVPEGKEGPPRFLHAELPPGDTPIDLTALKAWAGKPLRTVECPNCEERFWVAEQV